MVFVALQIFHTVLPARSKVGNTQAARRFLALIIVVEKETSRILEFISIY
jgi:hypothetical protein